MAINKFFYSLFAIAIVFLMIEKEEVIIETTNEEKPKVSFYDSVMYDITTKNVNQMIQSSEAYIYNDREELVNGLIITKTETKEDDIEDGVNVVKADYIIKIKNDVFLDGNVHLQLDNSIDLKTEQLEYNTKSQIAKNSIAFEMTKDESNFIGDNLYLDGQNNHIIAKNAKIKLKVSDEKK
ncbi:MAG: hypothetical protein U9N59_01985 [Campylobacterota bacterium]|nr:hypothetical protein [Campylobacterota bacterium]